MGCRSKLSLPKLTQKAQKVFNAWIRNRDKDLTCISCNQDIDHAGHYFSAGLHSALRFDEDNVHGQCLGCNTYRHGNLIYYRIGLVIRYGEKFVQDLEAKANGNRIKKWTRSELEEIIEKYKL